MHSKFWRIVPTWKISTIQDSDVEPARAIWPFHDIADESNLKAFIFGQITINLQPMIFLERICAFETVGYTTAMENSV